MTRAARKAATREQLLDAATTVFTERGYHGASVQEIAAAAGFTKGALYANFDGKEELFLAVIDRRVASQRKLAERLAVVEAGEAEVAEEEAVLDELEHNLSAEWALLLYEAILFAVRESPSLRTALAERYREVDGWGEAFLRRKAADPPAAIPAIALAQSALGEGLMLRRIIDPEAITVEVFGEVFDTVFDPPHRRAWQDADGADSEHRQ